MQPMHEVSTRSERGLVMPPWWVRLLYSFASALAAVLLTVCGHSLFGLYDKPPFAFTQSFVTALPFFLAVAFPGWLIAIPIVLAVTNLQGWRFWALLCVGAAIGPVVIFAFGVYGHLTSPRSAFAWHAVRSLSAIAAGVSTLTTLIYLCVLKKALSRTSAAPSDVLTS
jgi:hypothetical protein